MSLLLWFVPLTSSLLLLLPSCVVVVSGFQTPTTTRSWPCIQHCTPGCIVGAVASRKSGTRLYYTTTDDELEKMRAEIEQLKQQAQQKMDELSHKADDVLSHHNLPTSSSSSTTTTTTGAKKPSSLVEEPTTTAAPSSTPAATHNKAAPGTTAKTEKTTKPTRVGSGNILETIKPSQTVHADDKLLEGTYWKIMLNIGREEGTRMPKTWGESGDRLLLQLQVQFRHDQLYERDEFLGSVGGAKVCHAVHNQVTFGPSMVESAKQIQVMDGGWRISRGEGPMGTDLLHFYVELSQQVQRGDVSCPAGRVYFTCGYYDVSHRGHSRKVDVQRRLDDLADVHNNLLDEMEEEGGFSLKRMRLWSEMVKTKAEIEKTKKIMNELKMLEPDLSSLRLSRRRDVGLSKEGQVYCKTKVGPAGLYEYHILGRFQPAAVEHGNEEIE